MWQFSEHHCRHWSSTHRLVATSSSKFLTCPMDTKNEINSKWRRITVSENNFSRLQCSIRGLRSTAFSIQAYTNRVILIQCVVNLVHSYKMLIIQVVLFCLFFHIPVLFIVLSVSLKLSELFRITCPKYINFLAVTDSKGSSTLWLSSTHRDDLTESNTVSLIVQSQQLTDTRFVGVLFQPRNKKDVINTENWLVFIFRRCSCFDISVDQDKRCRNVLRPKKCDGLRHMRGLFRQIDRQSASSSDISTSLRLSNHRHWIIWSPSRSPSTRPCFL